MGGFGADFRPFGTPGLWPILVYVPGNGNHFWCIWRSSIYGVPAARHEVIDGNSIEPRSSSAGGMRIGDSLGCTGSYGRVETRSECCLDAAETDPTAYSKRSTRIGSIRAARRAGSQHATSATATSTSGAATNVRRSSAVTP